MSKFSSFVELLVKQTCRRASHEYEMAKSKGKLASEDHSLYSLEFLKSLHDQPRENILRLLKISGKPNNMKITNGLQWLNSSEFTKAEKNILLEFLIKVKDMSPVRSQKWIDLQHYLHYVYRNFANVNPDPSTEALSPFFINEMTELVKSLIEEDESQLYLRILAILREYCIFAQWNYSKQNDNQAITKLFYYYEAMLTAAKNLSSVFTEFEAIISKNYSLGWIDFNTSVFIRYFFQTEFVQNKIYNCLETKLSPGDSPAMFELLEDLKNLWIKEEIRVRKINENAAIDKSFDYYYIEEAMINCHKKVLTCNFWVERSQKDKDDLDLTRLDHHIFRLLSDPMFHPAGPILDRHGQCICEECLIAKYKCMLDSDGDHINEKVLKNVSRLTYCRRCMNLVSLDLFHGHINSHSDTHIKSSQLLCTTPEKSTVTDRVDGKLRNGSVNFPESVKTEIKTSKKDQQTVIKSGPCKVHPNLTNGKAEMDCTKLAFEQFLKSRKEAASTKGVHKTDSLLSKNVHKNETLLNKTVHNLIKIKKDIFCQTNDNNTGKIFDNVLKSSSQTTLIQKKKEILSDVESKVRERKNGHKFDKSLTTTCKSTAPSKCGCEKGCKHDDDDIKSGTCYGLLCDHHEETKGCDCTYCEVFGTAVASHTHKNNELRDRLRIRLHQRREKRSKDNGKNPNNTISLNSVKVKTVINKVEERVPLPSSPTNIPPAPVVKSSESSVTSSGTDDIHGLVNYIEGNSALNKMELAEKKAAKKARQRQKKEEERLKQEEARRKLEEEIKRKEAEKAKEIARAIAEEERAKKAAQNKILKANTNKSTSNTVSASEKKRAKKERRAQRKAAALAEINKENNSIIEETIPAMVTIKRIAENGGGSPTVTITLKGSTPDQDKLLYTLVGGADENVPTAQLENETITKKKKKKNTKANPEQKPIVPTVITKEVKVTVSLDATSTQESKKNNKKEGKKAEKALKNVEVKEVTTSDLSFPMLRLPPGITITKVEGPLANRNYPLGNVDKKNSALTVGAKSGVIVVDTETLIKNKIPAELETKTKSSKKNKKKNKKKAEQIAQAETNDSATKPQNSSNKSNNGKKMITLKNPIFQPFNVPKTEPNIPLIDKNDSCAPAAIFTNENGMVTIRSSRLQQSLSERGCANPVPLMPITSFMPETSKPNVSPVEVAEEKSETITPLNAQEILSGLPGIEITKVDKKAVKPEPDKSCQAAQVSIIPNPSNGNDQFSFDNDDWYYDNVFTPRDVLEDDMDADELELEAFKRFCQQSIPPLRKEKVTHLKVADIVLKKKTDNYV